jgi:hypothetical protein
MTRLIKSIAVLAALSLPASAVAADHEISLELGTTGHGADDNWFLFSDYNDVLPSYGVRLGFAVHDRVAVIGGWHHGAEGTRVEMEGYEDSALAAAYYADTFSLGAKADLPVATWFRPYATVQGLGIMSKVRLDDDTSDDDNPNQLERGAFSPGAAATAGVDFRVPFNEGAWALSSHLELGYHLATPASFDELGTLLNRGLVFRWGLGARF